MKGFTAGSRKKEEKVQSGGGSLSPAPGSGVSPAPESVSAGACQILISLVTQPWIWTQLSRGARLHDGI
ncbi:unnamed protein product [Caretta caretta]